MAKARVSIKKIEFIFDRVQTHCNIYYKSSEPGTPWSGGWKTKSFPKYTTAAKIMHQNVINYLLWNDGRELGEDG